MHSYARVSQPPNSHLYCPLGSPAPTRSPAPFRSRRFPPLPAVFQPTLRALGTHLPPGRGGAMSHHPACTVRLAPRRPHRSPAPFRSPPLPAAFQPALHALGTHPSPGRGGHRSASRRFPPFSSPPCVRIYRWAEVGRCPTILPVYSDRLPGAHAARQRRSTFRRFPARPARARELPIAGQRWGHVPPSCMYAQIGSTPHVPRPTTLFGLYHHSTTSPSPIRPHRVLQFSLPSPSYLQPSPT
ncbi:hypothetical protein C8F04DRAFT_1257963 [Mycena alexandri]|uniref:Uncharacterized protein n=1 Tax=Mycena alexandri TaxID=1745969 RepID=A0AAD6X2E0_9AGAR|nr:hypothetical protein C8F04DRAFT_1257963 [Mycena alexandri]